VIGGRRSINAVWTYEAPYPAVAEILGRLAFYPERVDAIEERRDAWAPSTQRSARTDKPGRIGQEVFGPFS
jgi:hypothetical protein